MLTTRLSCSAPDAEYSGRRRQDENSCRPPYIKLFGDLLAFVYHCFNRIVMHGYLTCLSRPEHVVPRSRRAPVITKKTLRQRTDAYQSWVEAFAAITRSLFNGRRRAPAKRTTSCVGAAEWRRKRLRHVFQWKSDRPSALPSRNIPPKIPTTASSLTSAFAVKQLPWHRLSAIGFEDLNGLKRCKSQSRGKNFRIAAAPWASRHVGQRIESLAQENRVCPMAVDPCPVCGKDDRRNRTGEMFRCITRDHKGDADFIGARNVLTKALAALGRMYYPRGQKCP
jgi:hypothetical protein